MATKRTLHLFHFNYADWRGGSLVPGVLRLSTIKYDHPTAPAYYAVRVLSDARGAPTGMPNFRRDIWQEGTFFGPSVINYGGIRIINIDGGLDWLADPNIIFDSYPWQWLMATYDPAQGLPAYSTFTQVMGGYQEQPQITFDEITFLLRDLQQILDVPIQTRLFTGDSSNPNNTEGSTSDIAGQPWPILIGSVFNAPLKNTNTGKNIYAASDLPISAITAVRDGGVALTVGTARATRALLLANTPAAGHYDYFLGDDTNPEALIRTNAAASQQLTVDAVGPARTNVFLYSQDFTNAAWTQTNVTVGAPGLTSPDGAPSACLVTDAAAADGSLDQSGTVIDSTKTHSVSVYVKAGTLTACRIRLRLSGGSSPLDVTATFNVANGTVTAQPGSGIAYIWPAANGFYRCCVALANNTSGNTTLRGTVLTGAVATDQGTLTLWQAQGEKGIVSPPIKTTSAVVTAAFDYPGSHFWYLLTQRALVSPQSISDDDARAANAARPYPMGDFIDSQMNYPAALDIAAQSAGASWGQDKAGLYRFTLFAAPSITPAMTFKKLKGVQTPRTATDTDIIAIDRHQFTDVTLRRPVYRVDIGYQQAFYVQTSGLNAAIDPSIQQQIAAPFRVVSYPDPTTVPGAAAIAATLTKWPNARVFTLNGGLKNRADAAALAQIVYALLGGAPYDITVHLVPQALQLLDLGVTVQVQVPRYGMTAGKNFVITGLSFDCPNNQLVGTLYG